MHAVCPDDFHMRFDLGQIGHRDAPSFTVRGPNVSGLDSMQAFPARPGNRTAGSFAPIEVAQSAREIHE
jgi:hypothetical protein